MRKKSDSQKSKNAKDFRKKSTADAAENVSELPEIKPVWVVKTRTLYWNGMVVLRLTQPADSLVFLLNDSQQAGWPQHRKNPFTDEFGQDPVEVLHDALKGLRKHKENKWLLFHGDGCFWELSKKALALLRKQKTD